ncbi:HEPN domain-containing protein [Methanophagales archaeon]|nr:MAG: HEPN domain-containing protein [Methanophagales archaeon]
MSEKLIEYRRVRAKETLEDAKRLFDAGSLFSAVNRIYYAMFYEVTALLLTKNLSASKHSGVRALFNKEFVKTGKVKVDMGKFFGQMFDFRQKSDYGDFVRFEEDKVNEWLGKAEEFIEELEKVIEKEKAG